MSFMGAGLILLSADGGSTLLVHDTRSGKWGFPKGHREAIDANEIATATRECFEETGLTPDDYFIHADAFKISKGSQSYLFHYAIMKEGSRTQLRKGPVHEIAGIAWVPLMSLFGAETVLDGNKYLRTWIEDVKAGLTKKSVSIFKGLLARFAAGGGAAAGSKPFQESVGSANIVACS